MKQGKKTAVFKLRIAQEDKAELQNKANAAGLSLSEYLVQEGLRRVIRSPTADAVLADLSLLKVAGDRFRLAPEKTDDVAKEYFGYVFGVLDQLKSRLGINK